MKIKMRFIWVLFILLFGCVRYEFPTYPSLDGDYIVRSVTIHHIDNYTSTLFDTVLYDGVFSYQNPIGPLDSMTVGQTRLHFSGIKLYMGFYMINGDPQWENEFYYTISQDILSREWVYLEVDYIIDNTFTKRNYRIIEDGLEYLVLECTQQYSLDGYDNQHTYSLRLEAN